MPTIPRFRVTQDAAWIFVHVHVPFVRVGDMEFDVDGTHFSFYCKPFLLKLQFPHEVVDDELAKAVYDPNEENGTIVVHLLKKEPGLEFPDLDLLTKLLQPKDLKLDLGLHASRAAPLIEVLHSDATAANGDDEDASAASVGAQSPLQPPLNAAEPLAGTAAARRAPTSASLLDLEARIAEPEPPTVLITDLKPTYGFNNAYADFFRVWHGQVSEIVSLPDPERTPAEQRRVLREAAEDEQFDVERYLLDFLNKDDDMYYDLAMAYEPFWRQYPVVTPRAESLAAPSPAQQKPLIVEVVDADDAAASGDVSARLGALALSDALPAPPAAAAPPADIFTDADRELLRRLPRKEFLVAREHEAVILGGLVDILVGFTYDHMTTQGDSGVESTWTASIVSPTLAWLDTTGDLAAVVRTAVRRILAFPFLRQYELALHVVRETAALLRRGKRVVLRALLALHRVVDKSETQYLLNPLYVQDYCIWVQSASDDVLARLGEQLARRVAAFQKADTGWALDELERSLFEKETDAAASSDDDASSDESDESDESDDSEEEDDDDEEEPAAAPPATLPGVVATQ
ncbi:hypothetical protein PybrP1_010342 [[Pythium] brassicae (nom. inval.)]|nr:hypothetical protein PybrP1_010342 [[Pythium] brassicae (nom. inval.)]